MAKIPETGGSGTRNGWGLLQGTTRGEEKFGNLERRRIQGAISREKEGTSGVNSQREREMFGFRRQTGGGEAISRKTKKSWGGGDGAVVDSICRAKHRAPRT